MNATALAAADYTRAGFALVPIPTGTKGPRTPNWQTREAAITSPDQASTLTANIGLAHRWCGTCAIDVDDVERAELWLRACGIELAEILAAPDAVQIVSGKANRAKLLFRLPDGVEALPTLKEADGALEFRCASRDGSSTVQDVLPPSIHPGTGKPYQWGGAGDWRRTPTLPDALLKLWRALAWPMLIDAANTPAIKQCAPERSARPAIEAAGTITEGGRNRVLASLAGTMRRKGMAAASIEAALLAENRSRCNPPLAEDEVRTIARSVSRYPSAAEHPAPADAEPVTWAKPQQLPEGLPDVPRFDDDLLPDALRPWLLDIANRMQCPLDYPAVGAMVALGAVVGQRLRIRPKRQDNWQEAPNLWGGIIGRPGAMKSPALGEALKPLKAIEGRALERAKAEAAKQVIEAMELKAREKALTTELEGVFRPVKAKPSKPNKSDPGTTAIGVLPYDISAYNRARGTLGGGRSLDSIRQDLFKLKNEQAALDVESAARRFTTNDPTVEKLGEILAANPHGLLVNRDELVGFMCNMDKPGHESDRAFYLEAWNASGSRFIYDRIARGTVVIKSPCVSVLGGTQPGVIGQYVREAASNGIGADGLMQRFQLLVWPDDPGEWIDVDRWPDTEAKQAAEAVYERLAELDPATIGAEKDIDSGDYFLRFDPEAQEKSSDWRAKMEAELRAPQVDCLNGHFAKYRKLVPALALLCHLADNPQGGPVGLVSLVRAIAWAEYLMAHALRIYAPALGSNAAPAILLADRIRARDVKDHFTARSIYLKGWRGLDTEATTKALELLEELDWVRAVDKRNPSGGRPTVTYAINPGIWAAGV